MLPKESSQSVLTYITFGALKWENEKMGAAHKIGHAAYQGPSVIKEIIYGITLGLMAGGLWKMHHWNNQRRTREFYDLLERGEISVVVEDE
ncbi:hypothetical protein LguiA_019602 [Lonicera macranthoides]